MRLLRIRVSSLWLALLATPLPLVAQTTVAGQVEVGVRYFPREGVSPQQQQFFPVLQGSLLAAGGRKERSHGWRINLFGRADARDQRRSHADLREATWVWFPKPTTELRGGILADNWGFTESNTVIDVVNQRDQLEAPNSDAKLGQPGVSFASQMPAGRVTVYALPWHRPWQFAGSAGRFRPPGRLDDDRAASSPPAWAARWQLRKRRIELGLSHFHGLSREPAFEATDSGYRTIYPLVHQTGAELQLIAARGLLKLDVVNVRSPDSRPFSSFTGGGEVPVTLGATDLTILAEFTYDQRGDHSPTGLDRDLLVVARWSANDPAGTEVVASSTIDLRRGTQTLQARLSRRLSAAWRWTAQSHVLLHPQPGEFGYWIRRDSFIQIGLARFF